MKNQAKYTSLCIGLLCAALSGCAGPSVQGVDAAQTESAGAVESSSETSGGVSSDRMAETADSQMEDPGLSGESTGETDHGEDNMHGNRDRGNRIGRGDGGMRTDNGGMRGGNGGGNMAAETDETVLAVMAEGAEKFQQMTFEDPDTGLTLEYNLYIPADYDENESYPLLMFIPDATAPGKTTKEIVEQYYGADIWVTDEEQEKHPSFVLVPNFSEVVVNDGFSVSDQVETAVNLIQALTEEYSVDPDWLYTTGQSMGCMTSLYLNSKYPDLFAASLFVSGQWDISVLRPLEEATFFYITAAGDEKASGGQDEVMALLDEDGISYSYGQWSAQDPEETQDAAVAELLSQGQDANFIRFELGTVLKDGNTMEHMASFNYAYRIPAVRDWLFAQTKDAR